MWTPAFFAILRNSQSGNFGAEEKYVWTPFTTFVINPGSPTPYSVPSDVAEGSSPTMKGPILFESAASRHRVCPISPALRHARQRPLPERVNLYVQR